MIKKFLLLAMNLSLCAFGMDTSSQSFQPQNILNEHVEELQSLLSKYNSHSSARRGINVSTKPWLPGFFIKYGVERVINAERLKKVIEEHNLDLLSVPEKFLWHVPGRPAELTSENYLVIVNEVQGKNGKSICLNFQQVQQLL